MDDGLCILLAEDNEDDALILQQAFHKNGVRRPLQIVRDGAMAIEYLHGDGIYADRIMHPFPNMVLLDLKMPKVSGFEVLEWLLQHPDYRVIPTIIFSASSDTRDVKHAFCLGANAFLCKPQSFEELQGIVKRTLAFWNDCLKPSITPKAPTCESLKDRNPFSGSHH